MVVWFEHGSSGQASICRAFNASDRCKALSTSNWETTKAGPNASFKQVEKCGNLVEKMKFIKLQQNLIFFWTKLLPMVWFCRKKTELGKKTHLFWVTFFRQDLPQLWFKKKNTIFLDQKKILDHKKTTAYPPWGLTCPLEIAKGLGELSDEARNSWHENPRAVF